MIRWFFILFVTIFTHATHFNGGIIRWFPVNPNEKSSSVTITIIQTYFWAYPLMKCAKDVPLSTIGRSATVKNIECVVDCSTDGGYSINPINSVTDCISASSLTQAMISERAVNITLNADAHFYASYIGTAWRALSNPVHVGLEWSILFFIDIRKRPDGLINTPPVVQVISPQFVIVNRTAQILIPVSDTNRGDDIRCRWSTYTPGFRRRRSSHDVDDTAVLDNRFSSNRQRRQVPYPNCTSSCDQGCLCTDPICQGTTCTGINCTDIVCSNTTSTTTSTITSTITDNGTNTTIDTPGTLRSTLSYPTRQAIDECGGICFPTIVPNDTTLSNCMISFRGLVANTWYAVAIQVYSLNTNEAWMNSIFIFSVQVEDFISPTSTTPMSSIPVQLMIYVKDEPKCSTPPVIKTVDTCLEVTVNMSKTFNLSIYNPCYVHGVNLSELTTTRPILGLNLSDLYSAPNNGSLMNSIVTWTPQDNQIGSNQLCIIIYTQ